MNTKLLFPIIIILTAQIFAQLESIKEFPKEYKSQEISELTPVWISENEILVFYSIPTLDTIYSRRPTDRDIAGVHRNLNERLIQFLFYQNYFLLLQ